MDNIENSGWLLANFDGGPHLRLHGRHDRFIERSKIGTDRQYFGRSCFAEKIVYYGE